jgi:3-hydroxyacyl-[acyl-carrier-protein] dehydratase
MCEAAAQLASYYAGKYHAIDRMVGLGGLEEVRFRDVVRPGNRFVIVSRLLKPRRAITTCEFQCFVNRGLVCEDILKGGALPTDLLGRQSP